MIRYYKGEIKIERISSVSVMKTALYRVLEKGINTKKVGDLIIAPIRLCWKKRKNK